MIAPEVRAAALGSSERGAEYEFACDKRIGLAMAFAERVNVGEGAFESGAISDDVRVRFHKPAKFSARSVSECWRRGGWFRGEGVC